MTGLICPRAFGAEQLFKLCDRPYPNFAWTVGTVGQKRPRRRSQRADEPVPVGWQVVVSVLELVGLSDIRGAITAAQRRKLTPTDVQQLVDRWRRLSRAHHATDSQVPPSKRATVGWLYRWITGASSPPSDDQLDAIESAATRAALNRERKSAKARQDTIDSIKHQTVIGCRRRGITDQAAIQDQMTAALQAAGFNDPKDWEW